MTQWEVKVVVQSYVGHDQFERESNELGKDGWCLVQVEFARYPSGGYRAVYRRRVRTGK